MVPELLVLKAHLTSDGSLQVEDVDDNIVSLYSTKMEMLPNAKLLYQLLLTHPVTSNESERSFTCVR